MSDTSARWLVEDGELRDRWGGIDCSDPWQLSGWLLGMDMRAASLEADLKQARDRIEVLEDIPKHLRVRSQQWLQSNAKLWTEVRHGAFPLGMVQSWIERAEESEARIEDAEAWGKRIEGERDLFLQRLEEKTARIEVLEQENERLKAQRKDQEPAGE